MGSAWDAWDEIPPLVESKSGSQAAGHIPPPPGATVLSHGQAPPTAPTNTSQYPWSTQFPHHPFPSPQDQHVAWPQYYDSPAYQHPSAPSPYIPRQPLHPQMQPHDPFTHHRRAHSLSNGPSGPRTGSNSHSPWPSQGNLSPLDLPARMPDIHPFAPHAPDMHTPTSTLSHSTAASARIPPGMYHERPQQWRHDFKFKSGFASMFRSRSNVARTLDDSVDSAKLDLHPFLCYSKHRPVTVYDLRRDPLTLVFRELDRPPLASDMDRSVTRPPTQYMRLYHPRLPWYIDIRANGATYISLADFFQQLFVALNRQISKFDFYNNHLDDEDREILTHAYLDRCRHESQRMEGVKRVDFLRGKIEWTGLTPGKNGMWRLKTG